MDRVRGILVNVFSRKLQTKTAKLRYISYLMSSYQGLFLNPVRNMHANRQGISKVDVKNAMMPVTYTVISRL